jgi:hypothetical protein
MHRNETVWRSAQTQQPGTPSQCTLDTIRITQHRGARIKFDLVEMIHYLAIRRRIARQRHTCIPCGYGATFFARSHPTSTEQTHFTKKRCCCESNNLTKKTTPLTRKCGRERSLAKQRPRNHGITFHNGAVTSTYTELAVSHSWSGIATLDRPEDHVFVVITIIVLYVFTT